MARGEAALTGRERQVVALLASPEIPSKAAAARELGLNPRTVQRHAAKHRVELALRARLARESDRAGSDLKRLRRMMARGLDGLEEIMRNPAGLTIEQTAGMCKIIGELTVQAVKVGDLLPEPKVDPGAAMEHDRRRTARALRAGVWLAAGRGLLGWRPQPVVLSPHAESPNAESAQDR